MIDETEKETLTVQSQKQNVEWITMGNELMVRDLI
jgi:hypothetical protein